MFNKLTKLEVINQLVNNQQCGLSNKYFIMLICDSFELIRLVM